MRRTTVSALPGSGARPLQTYGADRTCSSCDTRLSRYNESGRCSVHHGWGEASGPNRPKKD